MQKQRKIAGGLGNWMFQYAYLYAQLQDGAIPNLYLQSEKYFQRHRNKIKRLFGEGIGHIDKVSIHIRRGDYINNNFYVDLTSTDYYKNAVAMFPNETFLVFCADRQEGSDDKKDQEWCIRFMDDLGLEGRYDMFFGADEIEDMNAMASCKAHIMANSSFSWWASYLGHGKVVYSRFWYADGMKRTEPLDSWIRI